MSAKKLWRWKGLSLAGEAREGALWAADRIAAAEMLQQRQITPLSLKRCAVKNSGWRSELSCQLIQQLATLLQAGLTLSTGLTLLAGQHPSRQWQALLNRLAEDLENGVALSVAMQAWPQVFPPLYQAMIRTGELTGKLDECCFQLARQQQAQRMLVQKVKKALRYPLIILLLALSVMLAMVWLVLPEFAAIYQTFNAPLPALTRGVLAFADGMQRAGPLLLASLILPGIAALVLKSHPRWQRLRQRLILSAPVFGGLARGQKLSQIFTVLSLTQSTGIAFLQGLESVEETLTCPYWRDVIRKLYQQISEGAPIWQALKNSGEFSPLCLQLVMTGEASGALDRMLDNLARHHSEATWQQADNLAALLEPLLLVVTGAIVGTLVVAMYLPVFQLGDAISMG
ncbi:MAG TPA: protein transport protein HofC [Enterobacteriaceae bacterium]|nr:protein transport protein HofC [Enterobacteriaceae bacterium]